MKYINKILSIFLMALVTVSCDNDAEKYTPGEQDPTGCQGMYFSTSKYMNIVEVEPGITSTEIAITRLHSESAGTASLKVLNNQENVFVVPETVSFAAGEESTSVTISFPTVQEGNSYNLKLALEGDNVSLYADGYREMQMNLNVVKWDLFATGSYTCSLFGGSWEAEVYKVSEEERFRIAPLKDGYYFVFEVDSKGAITPVGHAKSGDYYIFDTGVIDSRYGAITGLFNPDLKYSFFDKEKKKAVFRFQYVVSAGSFGWFDDVFSWE